AADGFAGPRIYYAFCYPPGGGALLRRVSLDGSLLGDTSLAALGTEAVGLGRVSAPTGKWFIWNPFGRTIARLDPVTGVVEATATVPAMTSSTSRDGLVGSLGRGIGEWLAPGATAKMYLDPSIAVSPDGTRVYVLGVNSTRMEEMGGSSGVWVLDATSLRVVDRWGPTADFTSLRLSEDGRWVFAAGMPEFDAQGNRNDWPASVTAYDARTGQVRLIAGDLGQEWLFFASSGRP
ncbi:MAG: hypothetical protein M3301_06410, partial [Chloroflexota bacterium]|nr:hypothetical protein [Chloroflexota bacterium]